MGQPAEPGHISLGQAVTPRGLAARPAYGRVTGPGCDVLGQSVTGLGLSRQDLGQLQVLDT